MLTDWFLSNLSQREFHILVMFSRWDFASKETNGFLSNLIEFLSRIGMDFGGSSAGILDHIVEEKLTILQEY